MGPLFESDEGDSEGGGEDGSQGGVAARAYTHPATDSGLVYDLVAVVGLPGSPPGLPRGRPRGVPLGGPPHGGSNGWSHQLSPGGSPRISPEVAPSGSATEELCGDAVVEARALSLTSGMTSRGSARR